MWLSPQADYRAAKLQKIPHPNTPTHHFYSFPSHTPIFTLHRIICKGLLRGEGGEGVGAVEGELAAEGVDGVEATFAAETFHELEVEPAAV